MDDLLVEFLTETSEGLATLDTQLVTLEENPNDPNLIGGIFRIVHTIKGTCGFLGLPRLEKLAHAAENVLGKFRDKELLVTPAAVSLILNTLDRIKSLVRSLETTQSEPTGNDDDLIILLNELAYGNAGAVPGVTNADDHFQQEMAMAESEAAPLIDHGAAVEVLPAQAEEAAKPSVPTPAKPVPKAEKPVGGDESALAAQTIRVNVDVLENLMTLVSEMVLTRNQLLQILRGQKDSEFTAPLQRLNHVTSELQEGVMKTRMQPIGNAWAKLPRIVRDLAHELGKKIDLQMLGADTELDRQVLELIKDPLTHMVRNSADHGLELPADRIKAGKPEVGRVILNAYHEGGHIIIEIADDGRGLNLDRIKQKAIQNGLATEAEVATMSDQQIMQFIFRAGFSTASQVTSVSGRGVGMDVVRTNIEKIGGTIEMRSQTGKGSTFVIKIPLTLAIVSALIVGCAGERFAIPQIALVELVQATQTGEHRIETLNNSPFLRLRNRLLPLISLRKLLRLDKAGDPPASDDSTFIAVIRVGPNTFGIIVDKVFDTEEIVVKPVSPILRSIPVYSGNTILGDGSVIMILDPNGIASASGEVSLSEGARNDAAVVRVTRSEDRTALLLFQAGQGAPKAVPLSLVARLEEIDLKEVELSNGRPVVQYRGKLMPLVPIDPYWQMRTEGRQAVLVFADGERSMGLIVDEILDIVEDQMKVELASESQGFLGSAIIAGKATDILDVGYFLTQAFNDWFGVQGIDAFQEEKGRKILLVDDSSFFRGLLVPLLNVAGYEVSTAKSPDEALALRETGELFDVIVSDIEMPGMSGFDFAAAVRKEGIWQDIPMVALTSHATEKDLNRGRLAGFNDHVAKLDRDAVLNSLTRIISGLKVAA